MKDAIEMLQQMQKQFFAGGVDGPNGNNWDLKEKLFKDTFKNVFGIVSENADYSVDKQTLNQMLDLAEDEGVLHRFVIEMFYHFEKQFATAWSRYRMTQLSQATGERSQQVFKDWIEDNGEWKVEYRVDIFNELFEYIQDEFEIPLYDIEEPKTLTELGEYSRGLMMRIKKLGEDALSYQTFLSENLIEIFKAEWYTFMENEIHGGDLVDFCWMAENGGDFFRTENLFKALSTLVDLKQQQRKEDYPAMLFWEWCVKCFDDDDWAPNDTEDLKMFAENFGLYFKCDGFVEDEDDEDDEDDEYQPRWR